MKKSLLAACAVLGVAAAAQAAVVPVWTSMGTPVGTGGAPVATGYTGWKLTLTSDAGNIQGVDIQSGTKGLFGPMVQRWTSSGGDGVYDTKTVKGTAQNLTNNVNNFDSHLIVPAANYVGEIGFNEDTITPIPASGLQVLPFPANSDNAGIGVSAQDGFIKAAFGINGPAQASSLDMAYIVLGDGAAIGFRGTASVSTAGGTFQVEIGPPIIPEPTTLSLAGLGVLGLVARRRRA